MGSARVIRPLVRSLIVPLLLAVAAPSSAGATDTLSYSGCYEVALVRPRPVALLEAHMPEGFEVAPFLDPTGTMSAYISVGFRCAADVGTVVEMLDLVPVLPPAELAGTGASYLLVSGLTSRASSAESYDSWCVDIGAGSAVFDERVLGSVRAISVEGEHANLAFAIRSATTGGADSIAAAGTLRVLSVRGGRIGLFDIAFTSAASSPPVGAVWSSGVASEPALAVHVVPAADAPNDWSLSGRCVQTGE